MGGVQVIVTTPSSTEEENKPVTGSGGPGEEMLTYKEYDIKT